MRKTDLVFVLTNHDAVDVGGLVQREAESGKVGGQEHRDGADKDRRGGQAKLLLLHRLLGRGVIDLELEGTLNNLLMSYTGEATLFFASFKISLYISCDLSHYVGLDGALCLSQSAPALLQPPPDDDIEGGEDDEGRH